MVTSNKEFYETPSMLIFEVKSEGVICASGDPLYDGLGDEEDMDN